MNASLRSHAIEVATRANWHLLDCAKLNRDAGAIGAVKAVGRQCKFVRAVRKDFGAIIRRWDALGVPA